MMTLRSGPSRLRRRQRGSVLLEFAIVAPLLAMLALGTVEMGSAWNDSQNVLTSTRSGARSLAQFGDQPAADRDALLSVEAAYVNSRLTVEAVIIYEADDTVNAGAPPDACLAAAQAALPYNGTSNCNVYAGADYASAIASSGATLFGCGSTDLDKNWCPTQRSRTQSNATFVGVQVLASRTSVTGTGLVPIPTTLNQFSVMRMEPFPS